MGTPRDATHHFRGLGAPMLKRELVLSFAAGGVVSCVRDVRYAAALCKSLYHSSSVSKRALEPSCVRWVEQGLEVVDFPPSPSICFFALLVFFKGVGAIFCGCCCTRHPTSSTQACTACNRRSRSRGRQHFWCYVRTCVCAFFFVFCFLFVCICV